MINYNKVAKFSNFKYGCIYFYNKNKYKSIILVFILVLFLVTGVFTALKVSDLEKALKLVEFSFESMVDGDIYTFSFFIKRFASFSLVLGLLVLCASNKFTYILGYVLLGYRAFLLSLNCVLIIMYMGVGGLIHSIIIIFPCQLLLLMVASVFFLYVSQKFKESKLCGLLNFKSVISSVITAFIFALLINIIELLLLLLFKATSILVI